MINAKGEDIYTNAEIAYELGLNPNTINAAAKRLFGHRVPHWTLSEAKKIVQYIKSISIEEDAKRLSALHDVVREVIGERPMNEDEKGLRTRIDKDVHERADT